MTTSARRALFWSFVERYVGLMVAIASTMILARLLTPAEVGVYSLCAAFTAVAGILRDFGVSEYLIQEKVLTREKTRAAYALALMFAWGIGLLVFLCRGVVANFFGEPRVAEVLLVLSLHFAILPLTSPTFALLNRELAFRPIFAIQLFSNLAQAFTSVGLAASGFGVLSLAWGAVANVAAQTLLLTIMRPRESLTLLPALAGVREVLKFGSLYVSSRAVEVLTRNVHDPIIARHFDFASVGLFSRAFGLIDLFHNNVGAAVIRVATPAFAASSRAGNDVGAAYAKGAAIYAAVSWTFFGFVAVAAVPIIDLMFGPQWLPAAPLASALALSAIPQAAYAMAPQMLSAVGHVARRLRVALLISPVHLILVLVAAQVSLLAVSWVWLISSGLTAVAYLLHLRRALGMPIRVQLAPLAKSTALAGLAVAAQWLVLLVAGQMSLAVLSSLILSFCAGFLVLIAAARLLAHPLDDECRILYAALHQWLVRPASPS